MHNWICFILSCLMLLTGLTENLENSWHKGNHILNKRKISFIPWKLKLRLNTDAFCSLHMHESTRLYLPCKWHMISACRIQAKKDELSFLTHHLLLKFHIQLFNHSTQIHMKQRHYMCVCVDERHFHVHKLTFPFCLFYSGAVIMSFWLQNKEKRFSLWLSLSSWWHIACVCGLQSAEQRSGHKSWMMGKMSMNGNIMAYLTAPHTVS